MSATTAAAMGLALAAAASFAVANVAQTRAARRTEGGDGLDVRLLARLVKDRTWLLGLAASVLAYALQAVALFLAPVVLVQPLIVAELLFALPLAAWLAGKRLGAREWIGALLVAGALAVFVVVSSPSGSRTTLPFDVWVEMAGSVAVVVVVAVTYGERRRTRPFLRATMLSVGASACFGLMSVDTKVVGHLFASDGIGALAHPQPWLLPVAAIGGLLLVQTAFRTAPLSVSLPILDMGEPVVASVLAVTAFGERLGTSSTGLWAGIAASLAMASAGVTLLDTSPMVRAVQAQIESGDTNEAAAEDPRQPVAPLPRD